MFFKLTLVELLLCVIIGNCIGAGFSVSAQIDNQIITKELRITEIVKDNDRTN